MVVWQNPDSPYSAFKTWFNKLKDSIIEQGDISDSTYCPSCDSGLVLLKGPGVQLFIQQTGYGGTGNGQGGGPSGGNGPGFYCANLGISNPEPGPFRARDSILLDSTFAFNSNPHHVPNTKKTNPVTVALLDTGVDSTKFDMTYVGDFPQSCPGFTGRRGWNFIANNSNIFDDHPALHGTKVACFVLNQVLQYQALSASTAGAVNILPVKVFDTGGKTTMFKLLCGVAYAASSGARIINASFGFYEYTDTAFTRNAAGLMLNYLKHYLLDKNILMVAAAGNANHTDDSLYQVVAGPTANPRNLDLNHFYPASLDKYGLNKNLLVVTTISAPFDAMSPLQNFSPRVVDIGVSCDKIVLLNGLELFSFQDPTANNLQPSTTAGTSYFTPAVTGSSFATPIVTGKIAAYYADLVGNAKVDKDNILRKMQTIYPYGVSYRSLMILSRPGDNLRKFVNNGATSFKVENRNR